MVVPVVSRGTPGAAEVPASCDTLVLLSRVFCKGATEVRERSPNVLLERVRRCGWGSGSQEEAAARMYVLRWRVAAHGPAGEQGGFAVLGVSPAEG